MALLGGLRADQLIGDLTSQPDPGSPAAMKTVERLKKLGPKVIPRIIDALAMSDKKHTMVFVDILASYVNDKTLKFYQEGLADGGERVVSGTAWALSSANNYNANALLDFFDDKEVSKPALIEILKVHKDDLSVHDLLRRAYELEPKEKAALFRIIEDIITEDMVPDLINRMSGKDPAIKIHIMKLLGRFEREDIIRALEGQLTDPNKLVRSAALDALSRRDGNINIDKVAGLLQDPDLEVQNKAVDVIVKINHPDTIKYLVPALKVESEYTRMSAVPRSPSRRRSRRSHVPRDGSFARAAEGASTDTWSWRSGRIPERDSSSRARCAGRLFRNSSYRTSKRVSVTRWRADP